MKIFLCIQLLAIIALPSFAGTAGGTYDIPGFSSRPACEGLLFDDGICVPSVCVKADGEIKKKRSCKRYTSALLGDDFVCNGVILENECVPSSCIKSNGKLKNKRSCLEFQWLADKGPLLCDGVQIEGVCLPGSCIQPNGKLKNSDQCLGYRKMIFIKGQKKKAGKLELICEKTSSQSDTVSCDDGNLYRLTGESHDLEINGSSSGSYNPADYPSSEPSSSPFSTDR